MKDNSITILFEITFKLLYRRSLRWAGCFAAIVGAAIHTFHTNPLRDYNSVGIDPFEIVEAMVLNYGLNI
jgi:hypothetical protein